MAKVRTQVRVTSVKRRGSGRRPQLEEVRQKDILGAKYPRSATATATRPTSGARTGTRRAATRPAGAAHRRRPAALRLVYRGEHTCGQAAAAKREPQLAGQSLCSWQLEHAGWEQQSSLLAVENEDSSG
ncbi:hypothetical protein GUJ93_ZPchr0217g6465 [Zizania palustris]|uniref:Uncharacterized protein n=1 Tax=Zizania palustris TaxID=103762 RepID=A0A8J5RC77_ZIZPA|nr:hypothetical protein GUJ93_ZPchr0217g6465 [Zizania palustris]